MGGKLVKRKPFSSRLILTNNLNWTIGPLHDAVTWYKIAHAGKQVPQWDFQNKATRTSPHRPAFVLEVPLCATCSPAWVTLYHVTGSCKRHICWTDDLSVCYCLCTDHGAEWPDIINSHTSLSIH